MIATLGLVCPLSPSLVGRRGLTRLLMHTPRGDRTSVEIIRWGWFSLERSARFQDCFAHTENGSYRTRTYNQLIKRHLARVTEGGRYQHSSNIPKSLA